MKGAVVVGDVGGGGAGGDGGGGDGGDGGGEDAETGGLAAYLGTFEGAFVAMSGGLLTLAVAAVLGAEYYGDYAEWKRAQREAVRERDHATEAEVEEPTRLLDHEEFDPTGTLTLIGGYFAILLVMWALMYFVQFLGNGPTIAG
jgi:hypothetical protein